MSATISNVLLWSAVFWPLLLALPIIHTRLPLPRYLSLIPALLLVLLADDVSLMIPWLQFGMGFAIESDVRWVLLMSIAVWFVAATMINDEKPIHHAHHMTTLYLLTLSGCMGAILASDLVTLFSFSTLMGYAFYGLLVYGADKRGQRAGRLYIISLVLADLALFEALLLAASASNADLQFDVVHQAMSEAPSAPIYLTMVIVAFMLKAGIWPFTLWLSAAFQARPQLSALLGSVPVAMGLYGMLRWLPLGERGFDALGVILQIIGVLAVLYASFNLFARMSVKLFTIRAAMIATGLFLALMGSGLAYPSIWHEYGYLAYPYIAVSGLFLSMLIVVNGALQEKHGILGNESRQEGCIRVWVEAWLNTVQQLLRTGVSNFHLLWQAIELGMKKPRLQSVDWQRWEKILDGWSIKITIFVMLGLLLTWLAS